MEEKSNAQIKREWEAEQQRIKDEQAQDIRLQCIKMVKFNPVDKHDQTHPWYRAKQLEHFILYGTNPEKTTFEGF